MKLTVRRQRATERPRWFPASFFPNPSVRRIKLSVGGQVGVILLVFLYAARSMFQWLTPFPPPGLPASRRPPPSPSTPPLLFKIFEISSTLASKDENSLLAALAAADSPLLSESHDGIFTVERDWYGCWNIFCSVALLSPTRFRTPFFNARWLFRHILSFLRDGCLPDDEDLLRQLCVWKNIECT